MTHEYSKRSEPPAFYANTRKVGVYRSIRWLNDIRINSDNLEELKVMLDYSRDKISELDARLYVLSVNALTRLGIYRPLNPLKMGVQNIRRLVMEGLYAMNPLDPYSFPERGDSHIINSPVDLDVFLRIQSRSEQKM